MRNFLVFMRLKIKLFSRKPIFLLVFLIARLLKPKIVFTYNNQVLCDGTGAQIQRVMAIYSLAKSLGFAYLHSPIKDVSVHPLDSHQTMFEYKKYLNRLNYFIELPSDIDSITIPEGGVHEISSLNFKKLFYLVGTPWKGIRLIKLVDVYSIIDCAPNAYHHAREFVRPRLSQNSLTPSRSSLKLAVHYRNVPGDFSTYPGESQTRQIQLLRMKKVISRAIKDSAFVNFKLVVYTDAPPKNMWVDVFPSQENLWIGTPGFSNGKLQLQGRNLKREFGIFSQDVEIIVGGDPLETIMKLATADVLITSKSSLSYVPAILFRNSRIYSPLEFWHPVPKADYY